MYLKSPRRRREQILIVKCTKIPSNRLGNQAGNGSANLWISAPQSPLCSQLQFENPKTKACGKNAIREWFEKYRCVPKIASPQARIFLIVKCIGKYFSVPKIASPEARTILYTTPNTKKQKPMIFGQGAPQSTKKKKRSSNRIWLQDSPEKSKMQLSNVEMQLSNFQKYRCVPKIASPEARKKEY